MGNIFFIHSYRYFRDEKNDNSPMRKPEIEQIRSEDFESWAQLEGNKILNTTFGIWFYEGNLSYQKKQLKRDLLKLIEMIDDIKV